MLNFLASSSISDTVTKKCKCNYVRSNGKTLTRKVNQNYFVFNCLLK